MGSSRMPASSTTSPPPHKTDWPSSSLNPSVKSASLMGLPEELKTLIIKVLCSAADCVYPVEVEVDETIHGGDSEVRSRILPLP